MFGRAAAGIMTVCSHARRMVGSIVRNLSFTCGSVKTWKYLYSYSAKTASMSSMASHQ